ncbi:MAG: MFS transporter [Verrucomicrobiota bacterium]
MNRSLRINIAAGAIGMFWLVVPLGAPLPLLMQSVAASATQLGILSAVWQIATLAQIPAAFIAESMPQRKPLWAVTSILHRILWATPAALPLLFPHNRELWPVVLIFALGLSNILANLGTASWLSWMADIVPPESAGRFWSIRQVILSISMIIATALYGWILDSFGNTDTPFRGFQWVFLLCSLTGVLDIVLHCFVTEPAHKRPAVSIPWKTRFAKPFENRGFTILTTALAAWIGAQAFLGYTIGVPGFFSMVHLRETFGASYSQASLIFITACLGAVLFTPWLGRWIDKAGAQNVLIRLVFLGPISMAPWCFIQPGSVQLGPFTCPSAVLWISLAALFQGPIYTGTLLCQYRLIQVYTRPEGRTMAMALHSSIVGLGGAIAAVGAGFLKDLIPPESLTRLPGHFYSFDLLVLLHAMLAYGAVFPLTRALQNEPPPES